MMRNIEIFALCTGQAIMWEIEKAKLAGGEGCARFGNGDLWGTVVSPVVSDSVRCDGKSVFGGLAV